MTGKEVEERKATLVDKLKARAANLEKREMEEIIIILVDTSGSMEEPCRNGDTKLGAVKKSIPYLQARGSYIGYGLVGFGSQAYPIQQTTSNFSTVLIKSDLLIAEGQTNIPSAISEGLKMFKDRTVEKRRMILLSDGSNNCDRNLMERRIEECITESVIIDSISFGENADTNLLRSIARRTGGIYQHAASPLALQESYAKLNFQIRYLDYKDVKHDF